MIVGGLVAGQGVISLLRPDRDRVDVRGARRRHLVHARPPARPRLHGPHGARVKITEERLEQVEEFFERRGGATILIGRFIGLVRAIAPFIAGASRMPLRKFLPYDVLGAGLWATTFCVLGYVFWRSFDQLTAWVSRGLFAFGLFVAVVVGDRLPRPAPAQRRSCRRRRGRGSPSSSRSRCCGRSRRTCARRGPTIGGPAARASEAPARFVWNRFTPGDLGLEVTTLLAIAAVGSFVFFLLADGLAERDLLVRRPGRRRHRRPDLRSGWLVDVAKAVTALGSFVVVAIVVAATSVWAVVAAALSRRGCAGGRVPDDLRADPSRQDPLRPPAAHGRARGRRRERLPERPRRLRRRLDRVRGGAGPDRRELGRGGRSS